MFELDSLDIEWFCTIHHALWGSVLMPILSLAELAGEWGVAPLVLLVVRATRRHERLDVLIRILVSVLVASAVAELLKRVVASPRPGMFVPELLRHWSPSLPKNTRAWPSGHATTAFALASSVVTLAFRPRAGAPPRPRPRAFVAFATVYVALAVLTGIARVARGAHWPSDVLAGALVGFLTAFLTAPLLDRRSPEERDAEAPASTPQRH